MIILLIIKIATSAIDFSSTTYPFPSDSLISQYTNLNEPLNDCALDLISDGKCDIVNNKNACGFDGGDCCRYTCEVNCAKGCRYKCGSYGYDCIQNTFCSNCVNGKCNSMSNCYSTVESVKTGIDNCYRNTMAHGNSSTVNFYCGLDPNKTIVHDISSSSFHYPGCGLVEEVCSAYQCCTDIESNNVTSSNCTALPIESKGYNRVTLRVEPMFVSCMAQYSTCFINNSRIAKGECCECYKGWVGRDCDVPTCSPSCYNGICVGVDICNCASGWQGSYCQIPVCSGCVNGNCTAPGVCVCSYGWTGANCTLPYAVPGCSKGLVVSPNTCKCLPGYTGDRCDVPVCTQCNQGWCISPGVCECYPLYYTKNIYNAWCANIICQEVFGSSCTNCTRNACLQCETGYFLYNSTCVHCSYYDIRCSKCSDKCDLCLWPYFPYNTGCSYGGYIEFSSKYYTSLKSANTITISVYRLGPTIFNSSISYRITPVTSKYTKLSDFGYTSGSLVFGPGINTQYIFIPIYNSFTDKPYANTFYVVLYDPVNAVIYNSDLPYILDYSWSDKGINTVSYTTVEILDDLNQPSYIVYSQQYPDTIKTNQNFVMNFTVYNSLSTQIGTASVIAGVRRINTSLGKINCVFQTNNFSYFSSMHSNLFANVSSLQYSVIFSSLRGMYTVKLYTGLLGTYMKIYSNPYFSGSPIEEGIRNNIGLYNNYTKPLGSTSSRWEFVHFPATTISAYFVFYCSDSDFINLYVNENLFASCIGSCSSSYMNMNFTYGYWVQIDYVHYKTSPGFLVYLQNLQGSNYLNNYYAVNDTGKIASLYIIDPDEC